MLFKQAATALIMSATAAMAGVPTAIAQDAELAPPVPEWRIVAAENLLLIDTDKGLITIELNPDFAPNHVERIRKLAFGGILHGQRFYRVIDGFVAQAGFQDEKLMVDWPALENENDRPYGAGTGFEPLGNRDLYAPDTGHIDGFPMARSQLLQSEWLLHCPGAVAMARDVDPDSGSTEFYIVLDAQRYLDRNLTIFGRVIDGMEHVQALKRGKREVENGVIQPPEQGDMIKSFRVASDIPADVRPVWQVTNSQSAAFADFKASRRIRDDAFFYRKPPEILDICSIAAPARKIGP